MIQHDLPEIFNDCVNRLAVGWSVDECLAEYPAYTDQLRPMLEAGWQVRFMRAPQPELYEDQDIVWQRLVGEETYALPLPPSRNRRGYRVLGQLIAAVFLLILLVGATWFVLNRLVLPPNVPILETLTPTATLTETPALTLTSSATVTATLTNTPTVTPSPTLTPTQTSTTTLTPTLTSSSTGTLTFTPTPTPSVTVTATASPTVTPTNVSGCGQPLTAQDAVNAVLGIYPNTTITTVLQTTKFGGTLVWEVKTSHGFTVNIDVACGTILSIEHNGNAGSVNSTPTPGSGTNPNGNDNNSGGSGGDPNSNQNSNSNENSNSNDNSEDSGGSGMGSGS